MTKFLDIPAIEMDPEISADYAESIACTLKQYGVVRLTDTNITDELRDRCFDLGRAFMRLSDEAKLESHDPEDEFHQRGYTPPAFVDIPSSGIRDHKQFLQFGNDQVQKNIWPDINGFEKAYRELFKEFSKLFSHMMKALEIYFNLPPNYWTRWLDNANSNMRYIWYPPFTESQSEGAQWSGQHEDINLLTLLFARPGLQVKLDGEWYDIPCKDGEVFVNSAKLLRAITNNVMPSFVHRVVVPEDFDATQSRDVITFFGSPANEAQLKIARSFRSKWHPHPRPLGTGGEELHRVLSRLYTG